MMIGAIQRRKSLRQTLIVVRKINVLVHSSLQPRKTSEMREVTIADVVDLII